MTQGGELKLVRKAVEVLDALARERELTPARIAEIVGEPRSSVYRLLSSLQRLDMVGPGARSGTYCLGFHVLRLGNAVMSSFDERQLALPVMERVNEETGETVFLCVRRGMQAVCIERIEGRRVQSLALTLGGALPLHAGAGMRVLLAAESRGFWNEYVSSTPLERLTPSTPTTAEKLFPLLEEVRATGVSVSDGDVTVGIAALGVPIYDYRGSVRAALAISGVQQAIIGSGARSRVRKLLVDAGREVSRTLGYELAGEPIIARR